MLVDARRPLHCTVGIAPRPHKSKDRLLEHLCERSAPIKERFARNATLGIVAGLTAADALVLRSGDSAARLRDELAAAGLAITGIDGRSCETPDAVRSKIDAFAPDWRDPERLSYTVLLAWLLAEFLPAGSEGAISTTPLSFRGWVHPRDDAGRAGILRNLESFAEQAERIFDATGRRIRLALEPAPGAMLENVQDAVDFFATLPDGLGAKLRPIVGLSLDACSLTAAYDAPERAVSLLQKEGIGVHRYRLRAAIRMVVPSVVTARAPLAAALAPWGRQSGFHQVMERHANGAIRYLGDLAAVQDELFGTLAREWRVACPFPVHSGSHLGLETTQRDAAALLYAAMHAGGPVNLEVPAGERWREWSPADFRWALDKVAAFRSPPNRRAA